jgi:pimeloyl-ACP methyl ester carboxylesterase
LHGINATITPFTIEHFAEYLIAYIESNFTEKISVVGYRMGGYVAMYAAGKKPELFASIMTLATKYHWNEAIASKEASLLNPKDMERKIPGFVTQLHERHMHIDWKGMVLQTAQMLEKLGRTTLLDPETLAALDCKICIGRGDQDIMVGLDETVNTYRQLKNGSLFILPNTKHAFEKVSVDLLSAHIKNFFD